MAFGKPPIFMRAPKEFNYKVFSFTESFIKDLRSLKADCIFLMNDSNFGKFLMISCHDKRFGTHEPTISFDEFGERVYTFNFKQL
jgi:hypothetical protein